MNLLNLIEMKKLSCLIGAVALIVSFTGCKNNSADNQTQVSQFAGAFGIVDENIVPDVPMLEILTHSSK